MQYGDRPHSNLTQLRLRLYLPSSYQKEPIISRLIQDYRLVVNITGASLQTQLNPLGWLDIELRGAPSQFDQGLQYLTSLQQLKIVGKPSAAGDSWSY